MAPQMKNRRYYALKMLVITFIAYAVSYSLRKPLSFIKKPIMEDLEISSASVSMIDTSFLISYALFQIFISGLGDKFGNRIMISIGLVGAGVTCLFFGKVHNLSFCCFVMFVSGAFQALIWPNCVSFVSPWLDDGLKVTLYSAWTCSPYFGGVGSIQLVLYLLSSGDWTSLYTVPSLLTIGMGVICYLFLKDPSDVFPAEQGGKRASFSPNVNHSNKPVVSSPLALSVPEEPIYKIPGVLGASIASLCTKIVRYFFMLWLPFYAQDILGASAAFAGFLAICYELGGAIGAPFSMMVCKVLFENRVIRTLAFYGFSAGGLITIFHYFGHVVNQSALAFVVFMIGVSNNSADSLLAGPVPSFLGERGGRNKVAAVAGFTNGIGTLGGVVQGAIVGFVSDYFGAGAVFLVIAVLSFVGAFVLIPSFPLERPKPAKFQIPPSA